MKSSVFWLKNKLLRRRAYKAYKEAMRFDSLSGIEKQQIEFEKCKAMVAYAYNHVPYYKKYYDEVGFNPSQLHSWADWNLIPPLEKNIIRTQVEDLLSDEYRLSDLGETTTGGSTGTPLKVYKDRSTPIEVMGWRAFKWWNISPAANVGILHRRTPTTFLSKLNNRLKWWPTRRAYLNASKITEYDIEAFLVEIRNQKTMWLQGYCSALEVVADYILQHRIKITTIQMVWCTSSPLSIGVRQKLEEAFCCKVMDQYGCCEMWNIAMQKPKEQYLTVCNDFVHVDIVDENNKNCVPNVLGDILITDLSTFAFPLIKYRLGDKSMYLQSCEESVDGYPKIDFVRGRITDSIHLPNGTKIDGAYLTTICDNYSDIISSYQIYQSSDYSVSLKIVLKANISKENTRITEISTKLQKQLGDVIPFSTEIVDAIQGDRGKKRYIISEIALMKK